MSEPPLGVISRFLWIEYRLDDVNRAIQRYINAGILPLQEWLDEKLELEAWLRQRIEAYRTDEILKPAEKVCPDED